MSVTRPERFRIAPGASVWKSPAALHFVTTATVLTVLLVSVMNVIVDRAHSLSDSRINNSLIAGLVVQQTQHVLTDADAVIADLARQADQGALSAARSSVVGSVPGALPDGISAIRLLHAPTGETGSQGSSTRVSQPTPDGQWVIERVVGGRTAVHALVTIDSAWLARRYGELRDGSGVTVVLFDDRRRPIAVSGPDAVNAVRLWAADGRASVCLCAVTHFAGAPFVIVAGKPWAEALHPWYAATARLVGATSLIICILMALSVRVERLEGREARRLAHLSDSVARISRQVDRATLFAQLEVDATALVSRHMACVVLAPGAGREGERFALLTHDGTVQNVLVASSRKRRHLTALERLSLEQLAYSASHALDVIQLLEERRAEVETVTTLHREAERSRVQIEAMFAAVPDAVMAVDHDWRPVFANREARALLAVDATADGDVSLWDLLPPAVMTQVEAALRHTADTHTDTTQQVSWPPRADAGDAANERWIVLRAVGHAFGMTLSLQDVSQQIAADNRMHQTAKMEAIGQLTGGIAHDFNNLLTVIMGNLELVEIDSGDLVPDGLLDALRAARGAADLTHQLLAFARKQPLAPKRVDVSALLREMTGLLKSSAGPTIAVTIVTDESDCYAMIDRPQLQNALINLVVNARDAMPEGGTLAIRAMKSTIGLDDERPAEGLEAGDYVRIEVTDSGHGISANDLAHVFEPFFTTKQVGAGTGLGLSMVYGFVKQSRGHVFVRSLLGEGTTMTLLLPRSATAVDAATPGNTEAKPPRGNGEHVLLVEDVELVRDQTARMLKRLNYVVTEAADARAALDSLAAGLVPDLLLTDMGLPGGMNGHELAVRVRRMLPDLPLLFVTGYADSGMLSGHLIVPGVNLLLKPFMFLSLASHISMVLQKKTDKTSLDTNSEHFTRFFDSAEIAKNSL